MSKKKESGKTGYEKLGEEADWLNGELSRTVISFLLEEQKAEAMPEPSQEKPR